jgi:hypothetical protein
MAKVYISFISIRIRILNTLKTTAAMRRRNEIIAKALAALDHSKIIKKIKKLPRRAGSLGHHSHIS